MMNNIEQDIALMRAEAARLAREAHLDLTEHDACGVGLVAALDGKPRREVVQAGIDALRAVWHRGAVDADGKTGDGAGIHIEIPQDFFAAVVERGGDRLRPGARSCVAQVAWPKACKKHSKMRLCRSFDPVGYCSYMPVALPDFSVQSLVAGSAAPQVATQ